MNTKYYTRLQSIYLYIKLKKKTIKLKFRMFMYQGKIIEK